MRTRFVQTIVRFLTPEELKTACTEASGCTVLRESVSQQISYSLLRGRRIELLAEQSGFQTQLKDIRTHMNINKTAEASHLAHLRHRIDHTKRKLVELQTKYDASARRPALDPAVEESRDSTDSQSSNDQPVITNRPKRTRQAVVPTAVTPVTRHTSSVRFSGPRGA